MITPDLQHLLACPVCTYNRFFPTWGLFAAIRLIAVLAVGFRSFDWVRLLGLFVGFEVVYYQIWKLGTWYAHGAVSGNFVEYTALTGLLVLTSGIPALLLMHTASRFSYFTKPAAPKFTWRRALILVPAMIGITIAEGFHAGTQPS